MIKKNQIDAEIIDKPNSNIKLSTITTYIIIDYMYFKNPSLSASKW